MIGLADRRWAIVAAGVAFAALASASALLATAPRAETLEPSEASLTGEPTLVPSPATPAVSTPWPTTPPLPETASPASPAGDAYFGPVVTEPVRVRTGDGDCLNVRYLPGTTGQPRVAACAAEGTLLWLAGDQVEADGETWRYALGMGWVAARYTTPAAEAPRGFGPFSEATVLAVAEGMWTQAGRVTAAGLTRRGPWLPFNAAWGMTRPGPISPSGRYLAFSAWEGERAGHTVIVDLERGTEHALEGSAAVRWGPGDRLLVWLGDGCDTCPAEFGWTAPPFDQVTAIPAVLYWDAAWLPTGEELVSWDARRGLVVTTLDGRERVLPLAMEDDDGISQLVVSPSGRSVLAMPWNGAIRVVDLDTGAVRRIERPTASFVGGRCGGGAGMTGAWVDDETIAWHETLAAGNGNGIVVVHLGTGARRVVPLTSVIELRAAGQGFLTFSVPEMVGKDGEAAPGTAWLMDAASGDAWPATAGIFASWQ